MWCGLQVVNRQIDQRLIELSGELALSLDQKFKLAPAWKACELPAACGEIALKILGFDHVRCCELVFSEPISRLARALRERFLKMGSHHHRAMHAWPALVLRAALGDSMASLRA